MNIKEQLLQEIESAPDSLVAETLNFLQFLKSKQVEKNIETSTAVQQSSTVTVKPETPTESTGRSLLEHLKTIGQWEGDDLKECLEMVYASRGKARFDYKCNPFE